MIKKKFSVILPVIFLAAVIISSGCAKRVSTSQLDEGGTKAEPSPEISKPEPRKGEDIVAIAEPSIPAADIYEDTLAVEPAGDTLLSSAKFSDIKDIYFDFDQYTIRDDSRTTLQNNASLIKNKSAKKIIIEGHCDERGTNDYNLALGERRAQSTKRYLAALGINPTEIATISYGEEKPFCADQNEGCWQQNRRAHFVVE